MRDLQTHRIEKDWPRRTSSFGNPWSRISEESLTVLSCVKLMTGLLLKFHVSPTAFWNRRSIHAFTCTTALQNSKELRKWTRSFILLMSSSVILYQSSAVMVSFLGREEYSALSPVARTLQQKIDRLNTKACKLPWQENVNEKNDYTWCIFLSGTTLRYSLDRSLSCWQCIFRCDRAWNWAPWSVARRLWPVDRYCPLCARMVSARKTWGTWLVRDQNLRCTGVPVVASLALRTRIADVIAGSSASLCSTMTTCTSTASLKTACKSQHFLTLHFILRFCGCKNAPALFVSVTDNCIKCARHISYVYICEFSSAVQLMTSVARTKLEFELEWSVRLCLWIALRKLTGKNNSGHTIPHEFVVLFHTQWSIETIPYWYALHRRTEAWEEVGWQACVWAEPVGLEK